MPAGTLGGGDNELAALAAAARKIGDQSTLVSTYRPTHLDRVHPLAGILAACAGWRTRPGSAWRD